MTMLDATTAALSADARAFVLLNRDVGPISSIPIRRPGPTVTSPRVFPAPCVGAAPPSGVIPCPSPSTA